MYYRRRSSIFDVFTLNPLPYPVIMILAVVSIFLGISWFFNFEDMMEEVQAQFSWLLLLAPIVLILIVRWLSSMENPDKLLYMSPWDSRRKRYYLPSEGSSPWGVAALIVLVLILMQYQSIFLDSWFV